MVLREGMSVHQEKQVIILMTSERVRLLSLETGALIHQQSFDTFSQHPDASLVAHARSWGFYICNDTNVWYYPYEIV